MTFSDFAKVLYPYCSNGMKQTEFVVLLVDKIMCGRPGRAHQDGTYQNPLRSKDERTLLSYFNGERNIPRGDACIILSSIDKKKFQKYITQCYSEDAEMLLIDDLERIENINELEDKSMPEVCAQLFVKILHNLAEK